MDLNEVRKLAGIPLRESLPPEQALVEQIKQQIEPLFDTGSGTELLRGLAEYITTNLNNF